MWFPLFYLPDHLYVLVLLSLLFILVFFTSGIVFFSCDWLCFLFSSSLLRYSLCSSSLPPNSVSILINNALNPCSVTKSCPTLCNLMECSMSCFPDLHYLLEFAQTHVHWVGDAVQPSHPLSPLLLLPLIFPRISVFSGESAIRIRWPEYWSFIFSISPSNEYSGLISFRMDRFGLLAVHMTLKSLL